MINFYFCASITHTQSTSGALAQLARALDWQSKGQGFDSPMLHVKKVSALKLVPFFYF
jgi:hypothetical protein